MAVYTIAQTNGIGASGPVTLYETTTQVLGVAQVAAQRLALSTAIPRSVLAAFRYVSLSYVLSKSGVVDGVTVLLYLGTAGTSADTLIYSSTVFTLTNRAVGGGMQLRYNPATAKMQLFTAAQDLSAESGLGTTTAYPSGLSAVLADVGQLFSLYVSESVGTDVPALERFSLVGY